MGEKMKRSLVVSVVILLAGLAGKGFGRQSPVLAVFNIEDDSGRLTKKTRLALTDYLSTRMGEGGVFQVVPRAEMDSRLTTAKKKSYQQCYDKHCQVELGRELSANKILSSRLLKIGDQCKLILQVYDLKKAATEKTASVETACKPSLLPNAIDRAVERVGGLPSNALDRGDYGCPAGQKKIGDHCCWPGQDWGVFGKKCIGRPKCPVGFMENETDCVQVSTLSMHDAKKLETRLKNKKCQQGKVVIANHCCWPGQDWGLGSQSCIGQPKCPKPYVLKDGTCKIMLGSEEYRDYCIENLQLPCYRKCHSQLADQQYVRNCIEQSAHECRTKKTKALDCGADLSSCQQWCQKNTHNKEYCYNSCRDSYEREVERCQLGFNQVCRLGCPSCESD
jgi:hypothetical protein